MKSHSIVAASLLVHGACLHAQPEENPRFQPEERKAIGQVCLLSISQALMCKGPKKRWCSMEELMKELRPDRPGIKDPSDSDYRLVITVKGADIAIAAIPRKPGLGGFLNDTTGVYFNERGPASRSDRKIRGGADCDYLRMK